MSPYHHGNLREALIEAGIKYMSENGEEGLSLRRISADCGVSHAAAYSHFSDKNALLAAMRDHVTRQFIESMDQTASQYHGDPNLVVHLGRSYVEFFVEHPHYYLFLLYRMSAKVDLNNINFTGNYPPFEHFKRTALVYFENEGVPKDKYLPALVSMWAMVQGLASIAAMDGVLFDGDWSALTNEILTGNICM